MRPIPHTQTPSAHPLAALASTFILGILSVEVLPIKALALFCVLTIAGLLCLASLIKKSTRMAVVLLLTAFMFAGAALARIEKESIRPNSLKRLLDERTIAAGQPLELTGSLDRQPELAPEAVFLTLRVQRVRAGGLEKTVTGTVTLLIPSSAKVANVDYDQLDLRYGARLRVITRLKRTDDARNPGGSSFTEYLDRNGFDASGFVKSALLIERLDDEPVLLPLAWLYDWRQKLQRQINSLFAAETAGVLSAALLGNRYFLSRSAAEKFREGGTFHVLVISGLHISFIGGLVLLIARRVTKNRFGQFVSSAIVLWCYAIAVGAEASVVRAALMFTLVAFAPVVTRRGAPLNALGAAAIVLLAWRPGDLFAPSFQLTFLSVLAIVAFGWPLLQRMSQIGSWFPTRQEPYPPSCALWFRTFSEALFWQERKWKHDLTRLNYNYKLFKTPLATQLDSHHLQPLMRYAFAAAVISVCVQITLLPFFVVYFHRLSLSALVLNIGVSVIMAVLIITGIAALLLAQISSGLAAPLIEIANLLNWLMVHSVDPFSRLGVASVRLPEYSGGRVVIYALFYVPLVILAVALSRWNPLKRPEQRSVRARGKTLLQFAATSQIALLVIIIAHPLSTTTAGGKLRFDFLDVGQGDAALVTLPDGTTILIDGGGRPKFFKKKTEDADEPFDRDTRSIGEAVVSEFLWWRGLDRVDYVLATHADADHIDGLNDVARNFYVRAALVARMPASDAEYRTFAETLRRKTIPAHLIAAGDKLKFGDVTASVLWPAAAKALQPRSVNNNSIVLRFELGTRSILLTADIEKVAEAALVENNNIAGEETILHADVVKVAHHGSRTSSTQGFVNASRPKFAIISVGRNSMFGHPHAEVVARWRAAGAEILTTGESGTITVTTDGRELSVTQFIY